MLKRLQLVLTREYRNELENSRALEELQKTVKLHKAELWVSEAGTLQTEYVSDRDALWMSDDADSVELLAKKGAFTIAIYHKKVTSLLSGTQFALEGLDDIDWEYLDKVYQRYRGIPWEITQTKRCRIREMYTEDLDALYELYAYPQVTRYMENLFEDKEMEKQYITEYIENVYKYYGFGTWLIHRKTDGVLLGRAGFQYRPGYEEAELGFVIGYPYWRQGYAFEVCEKLLQIGKEVFSFDRIQAFAEPENTASIALLKKLGFFFAETVVLEEKEYDRYLYE